MIDDSSSEESANDIRPLEGVPDTWIAAQCPLCGAKRSFLPSEIFRGKLSYKLGPKPRSIRGALMSEMKLEAVLSPLCA